MTDIDIAAAAAGAFVDGITAVSRFGRGHIHDTFLVETTGGDYVLQRVNTSVFVDPDAVTRNIRAVHDHVRGALIPEPVATFSGEWLVRDHAATWRAWRRVRGAAPVDVLTTATAGSAGRLLGQFHALLADLDPATVGETLPRFHDPRRRLEALRSSISTDARGRVAFVGEEIELVWAAAPLVELADELRKRVPGRVAHSDAKLDNVLFRAGEAVCIVDLDTTMPGAWFWDVGDLVRTASTAAAEDDPTAAVDPALYGAVLDGYRQAASRTLDSAELDALDIAGPVVTFEQAVRFLTDWIDGDVYYRTDRPDQNLDRARAQLRLLASMPGTVPHA